MNCLITGINGVVGSNLASLLSNNYNWDVHGVSLSSSLLKNFNIVDLRSKNQVDAISHEIEPKDIVIHCAGLINPKSHPSDLIATNVIGTINALNLAKKINAKKFINISGVTVIGEINSQPISELHICNPSSLYHLSKLQAEQIIDRFLHPGLDVVTLRLSSPVGLNMPKRNIFPILLDQALKNLDMKIFGHRQRRQNFLDIRDLARAIFLVCCKNGIKGTYNIGSGNAITNLELANKIRSLSKSTSKIIDLTDLNDAYYENWDIDLSKAYSDFEYKPEFNIDDTINWVIKKGSL
jgi:UDP-glucose 4-epimerase